MDGQLPLGPKGEKEGGQRFGLKLDFVASSQDSLVCLPDAFRKSFQKGRSFWSNGSPLA